MSRLCTPYHIAYLVRAAESYDCITSEYPECDAISEDLARDNWEAVIGSPYKSEEEFDAYHRYIVECREALGAMPVMEEDTRPVLTMAACHWYQAQGQGAESTQSKRLVDSLIVAASYQLPCMEEECGIL